jgi:hypothetical protein
MGRDRHQGSLTDRQGLCGSVMDQPKLDSLASRLKAIERHLNADTVSVLVRSLARRERRRRGRSVQADRPIGR